MQTDDPQFSRPVEEQVAGSYFITNLNLAQMNHCRAKPLIRVPPVPPAPPVRTQEKVSETRPQAAASDHRSASALPQATGAVETAARSKTPSPARSWGNWSLQEQQLPPEKQLVPESGIATKPSAAEQQQEQVEMDTTSKIQSVEAEVSTAKSSSWVDAIADTPSAGAAATDTPMLLEPPGIRQPPITYESHPGKAPPENVIRRRREESQEATASSQTAEAGNSQEADAPYDPTRDPTSAEYNPFWRLN